MMLGDKKSKGISKPNTSDKQTANKKKGSGPRGSQAGPGEGGSSSGKDKQVKKQHQSVNPSSGLASLGGKTGIGPQFVIGNEHYDASAKTLCEVGVVCFEMDPTGEFFGPGKFDEHEFFRTIVQDAGEIKSMEYVLGGFAALNFPTSFHHPSVRNLREYIFSRAMSLKLFDENKYVAMGFDRVLFRLDSQSPGNEKPHRDISQLQTDGDVFGGWTNLTQHSQYFRCAPATHTDPIVGTGFAKLPDADVAHYTELMQTVEIKAGHTLLFNQKVVHEILSKKSKHTQVRLFNCIYTSSSDADVLHGKAYLDDVFKEQSTPKLPSNQECRTFPGCYTNYPANYKTLSEYAKKVYIDAINIPQKGKITDKTTKEVSYVDVTRPGRMQLVKGKMRFQPYFPSLKAIGKECVPYDQAHMDLFSLKKEHWALTIGYGAVRQRHTVGPVPDVIEID